MDVRMISPAPVAGRSRRAGETVRGLSRWVGQQLVDDGDAVQITSAPSVPPPSSPKPAAEPAKPRAAPKKDRTGPAKLVGALQDTVHKNLGRTRKPKKGGRA